MQSHPSFLLKEVVVWNPLPFSRLFPLIFRSWRTGVLPLTIGTWRGPGGPGYVDVGPEQLGREPGLAELWPWVALGVLVAGLTDDLSGQREQLVPSGQQSRHLKAELGCGFVDRNLWSRKEFLFNLQPCCLFLASFNKGVVKGRRANQLSVSYLARHLNNWFLATPQLHNTEFLVASFQFHGTTSYLVHCQGFLRFPLAVEPSVDGWEPSNLLNFHRIVVTHSHNRLES